MKNIVLIFIFFVISTTLFSSCEKDDICPPETHTTPLLKIGFFNFSNGDNTKTATALRIVGIENNETLLEPLNTFEDRTNQTEISVPLKAYENTTSFLFIQNSADNEQGVETGNIDTLTFNYSRKEHFVSRGCGYSVNIEALETISTNNGNEWISAIVVQQQNLQNQDTIHVKILH